MMSIEQAVTRFFADLAPARAGDTVLCALSGGPDSVTLFHLLRTVLPERGIALAALHLNHGLRGEQADRDEAFGAPVVRALAGAAHRRAGRDAPARLAGRGERGELCPRAAV